MKRVQTNPALLLLSLLLLSCGSANTLKSGRFGALSNSIGATEAVAISSISPIAGNVTAIPNTVSVNFSNGSLDPAAASSLTTYSISCGGNPVSAQSVVVSQGSVTVTLPAMTGIAYGTQCTFAVSSNLKDSTGNYVVGTHTAVYTLISAAAAGWNEAAYSTPTPGVGSNQGNFFSGIGSDSMALQGLLLNGTQSVDGIVGIWAPFGATSLTYGPPHGATAGGYTQFSCPVDFRITGVFGMTDTYIHSMGIICKTADQSQTYRSSTMGGSGGIAFELSCPAGMFATDLNGRATNFLDYLSLGCR
jgi:hypothetical protein